MPPSYLGTPSYDPYANNYGGYGTGGSFGSGTGAGYGTGDMFGLPRPSRQSSYLGSPMGGSGYGGGTGDFDPAYQNLLAQNAMAGMGSSNPANKPLPTGMPNNTYDPNNPYMAADRAAYANGGVRPSGGGYGRDMPGFGSPEDSSSGRYDTPTGANPQYGGYSSWGRPAIYSNPGGVNPANPQYGGPRGGFGPPLDRLPGGEMGGETGTGGYGSGAGGGYQSPGFGNSGGYGGSYGGFNNDPFTNYAKSNLTPSLDSLRSSGQGVLANMLSTPGYEQFAYRAATMPFMGNPSVAGGVQDYVRNAFPDMLAKYQADNAANMAGGGGGLGSFYDWASGGGAGGQFMRNRFYNISPTQRGFSLGGAPMLTRMSLG